MDKRQKQVLANILTNVFIAGLCKHKFVKETINGIKVKTCTKCGLTFSRK